MTDTDNFNSMKFPLVVPACPSGNWRQSKLLGGIQY